MVFENEMIENKVTKKSLLYIKRMIYLYMTQHLTDSNHLEKRNNVY